MACGFWGTKRATFIKHLNINVMSNFKLKYLDSLLESDYIISPQKVVNDLWGSNAQEKMEFSYDAQEEKRRKSMSNAQERMEFSLSEKFLQIKKSC
ncbi:MAG: hypothetical protein BGO34_06185 [Bacteroidia bacterium 44-10]|nr:MAG: hypothetical protein BGO34_06185 [Bacteroidia bacterium 44-10]